MSVCDLRVPGGRTQFRPMIPVKFNGRIEAFAAYGERRYRFDVDDPTHRGITEGRITVDFKSDLSGGIAEIALLSPS